MSKVISVTLGPHLDDLIDRLINTGRYETASDVIKDALTLFEQQLRTGNALQRAIEEGYASGISTPFDWNELFDQTINEATPR